MARRALRRAAPPRLPLHRGAENRFANAFGEPCTGEPRTLTAAAVQPIFTFICDVCAAPFPAK